MAVNLMHNMQAAERVYDFAEKIAISLQGRQACPKASGDRRERV